MSHIYFSPCFKAKKYLVYYNSGTCISLVLSRSQKSVGANQFILSFYRKIKLVRSEVRLQFFVTYSDLATLLRGNKRKTPKIEFGAHQAILVVNEAARDNIPDELNLGLILTIYEAKGLVFDDILLYNFFKDSEVQLFLPFG